MRISRSSLGIFTAQSQSLDRGLFPTPSRLGEITVQKAVLCFPTDLAKKKEASARMCYTKHNYGSFSYQNGDMYPERYLMDVGVLDLVGPDPQELVCTLGVACTAVLPGARLHGGSTSSVHR